MFTSISDLCAYKSYIHIKINCSLIDCAWSEWIYSDESIDHCSKSCGGGERHRKRRLESIYGSKGNCYEKLPNKEGYQYEVETCNTDSCIGKWIYQIPNCWISDFWAATRVSYKKRTFIFLSDRNSNLCNGKQCGAGCHIPGEKDIGTCNKEGLCIGWPVDPICSKLLV